MSRIGKKPVPVPAGVQASVEGQTVKMKGPKGALQVQLPDEVAATVDEGALKLTPRAETKRGRAMWGLSRSLVANLANGVTSGFEKRLEITGVGVVYPIPEGISVATPRPTEIVVTGVDKQKVGQVAAEIRAFRPPEPYKGKGVKYAGEYVFRKEGKKK
jgi:large subunit ribosomal protein L6